MDSFPLVSVLIPIYGVEQYVEASLRSVLQQDYPNLEVILVDDYSPDQSVPLAQKVIEQENNRNHTIQWVHHKVNQGLAVARLSALQEAKGEFLLFLDSDDYWNTPSMVGEIIAQMIEKSADLALFNYTEQRSKTTRKVKVLETEVPLQQTIACLKGETPSFLWNKCFRRDLFLSVSAVWLPTCNLWEDMHNVPLYIFHTERIIYIDQYYLTYRRLPNSVSNQLSPIARASVWTIHQDLVQRFSALEYKDESTCQALSEALEVNALLTHMIRLKTNSFREYKEIAQERTDWKSVISSRKGWSARWDAGVLFLNRIGCYCLGFRLFRLKTRLIRMIL